MKKEHFAKRIIYSMRNVLESYYLVADWVDFLELSIFINASLATLLINILSDEVNRGHRGHWKKDFVRYHLYCFPLKTWFNDLN